MRALLFSGLTLLVGAPAGWLVTQDAPRGQQALAPNQTAATGLSDDNQSPAPQPPTAPRPTQPPMVPQDGALPLNVSGNAAVGGAGPVMGFPLRGAATASGTDNRVFGFRLPGTRAANNDPNEIKARQLAAKVRATDDESARKAMLAELQALTDESFETMMRSRREQLAKAGQRLDELVERLEERQQLKSEIVKRRVAELLDQPDPLSWETPTVSFAVEPPARFPTPTRGNAADPFAPNPYVQARAGGSGSFGGGSGGGTFGGGGAGGSDPFGGGSGGGYRGPANRLPARTPQDSDPERLQAELAARRAQLAAQNAVLQEQLRAIEQLQSQAQEQAQLKAAEKERAKFDQDSNN